MYLPSVLEYLLWPAFMIICWFAVKAALMKYEQKFPENEEKSEMH